MKEAKSYQCSIADTECKSVGIELSVDPRSITLRKAVNVLNEAMRTAPGMSSHLHWLLPFVGDSISEIEFFEQNGTVVTNLLGILNGFLSYVEHGITHRLSYSNEASLYYIHTSSL